MPVLASDQVPPYEGKEAMSRPYANFIGVDDGPFPRDHRGDVVLAGAVFTQRRLDGIVLGRARRDGRNATERIARLVEGSPFNERMVLLGGIAVGGWNVVDIHALHRRLGLPVLVVARRQPDMARIERSLLRSVPGGARKWALVQKAGPMEPCAGLWVQRAGLSPAQARQVLRDTVEHAAVPEPLRIAHLIAGAVATGTSRGSA